MVRVKRENSAMENNTTIDTRVNGQKENIALIERYYVSWLNSLFFFFNDTATTEIYTESIVGSVRCV